MRGHDDHFLGYRDLQYDPISKKLFTVAGQRRDRRRGVFEVGTFDPQTSMSFHVIRN